MSPPLRILISVRLGSVEQDVAVRADLVVEAVVEHLRQVLGAGDQPMLLTTASGRSLDGSQTLATAGIRHGMRLVLTAADQPVLATEVEDHAGLVSPEPLSRAAALRLRFGSAAP